MEIGDSKGPQLIAPNLEQVITRAPNGWIWTSRDTKSGHVSSVFVPEKRFRKRITDGSAGEEQAGA